MKKNPYPQVCKWCKAVIYTPYELYICPKCRRRQDTGKCVPHVSKKNTIPRKGIGTRKFSDQTYYYAGRTLFSNKAGSVALELAAQGVRSKVTKSSSLGYLIWTDRPMYIDLEEKFSKSYHNPHHKVIHALMGN